MTIEKAIEILKYNKEMCSFNPNTGEEVPMNKECAELADACGVAVKALEEVKKHQETFEFCTGCKEYDKEANCCHRWTKVIHETIGDIEAETEAMR